MLRNVNFLQKIPGGENLKKPYVAKNSGGADPKLIRHPSSQIGVFRHP